MVELFEQDIRTSDRQSSKGNQLKWKNKSLWYKADYTGYEGLVEYTISKLLLKSSLRKEEYVLYEPVKIKYKNLMYLGVSSADFLEDDWQIITLERLFGNFFGQSLNRAIYHIENHKERLAFLVNHVERITGLENFGMYMNKVLTIDAIFLNEDRHTHNLAVLMNGKGDFRICPIFDNGAGLLADITMDYPLGEDIYEQISNVKGKTFSADLEEQMDISEELYGRNIRFAFSRKDVENILALDGSDNAAAIYDSEVRKRVRDIICEQIRRYPYLFK